MEKDGVGEWTEGGDDAEEAENNPEEEKGEPKMTMADMQVRLSIILSNE